MTDGPVIRAATSRDRPRIATLQAASWSTAYADVLAVDYLTSGLVDDLTEHWASQPIADRDVVLVAETGADLIGFIAVWDQTPPFIDNLHVDPNRRSSGLGTQLMHVAAHALHELGHDSATLWVVSDNTRAIRFYKRLGGQVTDHGTKDLFGTPAPVTQITWRSLAPLLP